MVAAPAQGAARGTMPTQVMFERSVEDVLRADFEAHLHAPRVPARNVGRLDVELSLHHDLASIEADWRAFEASAECTVFQTFDWLSTWFRNIGVHEACQPAIVIGRHEGTILFLMPFALEGSAKLRKITWLGSFLCNYNGPVLARDFSRRVSPLQFAQVWQDIQALLRHQMGHDIVDLEKMPTTIGEQANPFCSMRVRPHVNDAYMTAVGGDWEAYYAAKRSPSTRKTDRKKRKRLADHGETRFITASSRDDVVRSVDALIDEKRRAYAKLGVANMFERPGYRDFFVDLATGAQSSGLTHVSRVDVGEITAAANFGLMYRGRYYYILAGYDDGELARFGPGAIQLRDVMRYAAEHDCPLFDFTNGDEPYKREWCDVEVGVCDYVAHASWRGALAATSTVAFRQIKRWVKRNPTAWALARKARSMLRARRLQLGCRGRSPDQHVQAEPALRH
jgi:CelD/BcsL family acetyltransferase involved in cellulose biosynthesis